MYIYMEDHTESNSQLSETMRKTKNVFEIVDGQVGSELLYVDFYFPD